MTADMKLERMKQERDDYKESWLQTCDELIDVGKKLEAANAEILRLKEILQKGRKE